MHRQAVRMAGRGMLPVAHTTLTKPGSDEKLLPNGRLAGVHAVRHLDAARPLEAPERARLTATAQRKLPPLPHTLLLLPPNQVTQAPARP